jgi:hypothetical protein
MVPVNTYRRSHRMYKRPALSFILSLIFCLNSFTPILPNPRTSTASTASVPNPPFQDNQNNIELNTQPAGPQDTDLPPGMSDAVELLDRRTANSSTFLVGESHYATVLSAEAIHYQDSQGKWQVTNPSFQRQGDSFIVANNAIRSRVGLQAAWISASFGETAFFWEAQTLLARSHGGNSTNLAKTLETPLANAVLTPDKRTVSYSHGWSESSLVEEIISAPDSLEHRMIFNHAPAYPGKADSLELLTLLELQPGASLWLDGNPAGKQPAHARSMEVRAADGLSALSFEPVVAFEQKRPDVSVKGEYSVRPGAKPGEWIVALSTPWNWWSAPQRNYPVVLDPTMKVLKSTGYADGMAWVRSTGAQDYTLGGIRLGAHLPDWNTETRGYVQFNSLPAILTNAPVKVKKATLLVEPTLPAEAMPLYKNSPVDWEYEVIERKTDLYYVGACPSGPNCTNQFSIHDNRLLNGTYNWTNSPSGTKLATKPLKAGPAAGTSKTYVTEFDVTASIQDWYTNSFGVQVNRPGPTFMLQFVKPSGYTTICPKDGPYVFGYINIGQVDDSYKYVPYCIWFDMQPGKVRLLVEYDELPLTIGTNLLNQPGVPSYLEGVFEDTNHQYDLTIQAGFPHWRMAAVRGNHDFVEDDPGTPARSGLRLWDFSDGEPTSSLANAAAGGPDATTFVAIDDHHPSTIGIADLKVDVTSSSYNDYATDLQRNYRLEYSEASAVSLTYSDWTTIPVNIPSDHLSKLVEFNLNEGDNLLIKVSLPPALEVVLIEPGDGSEKSDAVFGADDKRINRGFQPESGDTRTLSIGAVPKQGVWALAILNQERPSRDPVRPQYPLNLHGTVDVLVCAEGSIPSVKFTSQGVKCQPLILPDSSPPPNRIMPIESGGSLTIHSEGGFVNNPAPGVDWCTTNEGMGAPVIESANSVSYGTYIFVGQGSVCRQGSQLYTTPESGVGLAVPVYNFNPSNKRGKYAPGFIYGDTGFYPLPAGLQDGVVQMAANGDLLPQSNTRRNIRPFQEYWENEFSLQAGSERISIADLRAHGAGQLGAQVMVDIDQASIATDWDISWTLNPNMDTAVPSNPAYNFVPNVNQTTPLPLVLSLASLEVRLVNGSNPDGLLPILDSLLTTSGPSAYQFRATGGRVTTDASLGGATALAQGIVQPPGRPRQPENKVSCEEAGVQRSCFDLRKPDYDWLNGDGEKSVKPWELPDIHIEDQAGTVSFSQPGQLHIFSIDHPDAANLIGQTFSFDTWEATVVVDHAACYPGGPITSVVRGKGFIALPTIGGDGGLAPPYVEMEFMLCATRFQEATLKLAIPAPGIPIGSSGLGVNLIGGTVTVGPDSTQIKLEVGFQTLDLYTLTDGTGTVTINTDGLFGLQAKGKMVDGVVDLLQLKLDVAWDPLDILSAGELGYKGFLSGGFSLHSWIGQGWQNKYSWLPDNNDFHFTGTIKASIKIPKGELINKKYFKLPPFTTSFSAKVAFGEFCTNSSCTSYAWGMSATVEVFGYDVGVYVDSGGPDLILGTSSHKLIDQFAGSLKAPTPLSGEMAGAFQVVTPGMIQSNLLPPIDSTLDTITPELAQNACTGYNTSTHTCSFSVSAGVGKALFSATWENGSLEVDLIMPDDTVITQANAAAHGVMISTTSDPLNQTTSFSVKPVGSSTLMTGAWKLRLDNVGIGLQPGLANNYSLLFAADPPAPAILWQPLPAPDGAGVVNLGWTATRGGQPLEAGIKAELFYAPVVSIPKPHQQPVTFPGSYQAASGLGPDWSPSDTSTQANDDNQDGVWKFTANTIPSGAWEFKVALGGTWDENYGLAGEPDGANIPFTVANTGDPVNFYYDPRDNTVVSRPDSRIVVLVGDMLAEIGGVAWSPDNLVGWMKDPDGDQVYEISLQLPAGNWNYKVAINESWAENYGLNGQANGDNIPLSVPAGGSLVTFLYDDTTHQISAQVGAPVMAGTVIANRLDANANAYAWNTRSLASGLYRVGIRLDDHLKGNAAVVAWAPGYVTIADSTPPPVPIFVGSFGVVNGLVVRWQRDDLTPDLAGYLVEYTIPAWDLVGQITLTRRVLPHSKEVAPFFEQYRLGGLVYNLPTTVCVRAYDASGNISGCDPQIITMPEGPIQRIGPPTYLSGGGGRAGLSLTWDYPLVGTPDGFLLYYAPAGCLLPGVDTLADQGKSPINLPAGTLNFSLSGLTIGQRYRITVYAYTSQGDISPGISIVVLFGDPTDNDSDGMADEWEALYGVSDPLADTDQDGLNNLAEFQQGSNPVHADSDGDGFYDGEEAEWGTDLCGPGQPPYHNDPKLVVVSTNTLNFQTAINYTPAITETIQILNFGGGSMNWTATPDSAWIVLSNARGVENETLGVSVDPAGLAPGVYAGSLTIATIPPAGSHAPTIALQESVTIPVELVVLPEKEPRKIFLPLLHR